MYYRFIKLKGFKRLVLSGCDEISVEFTDPLQVVLGTNGIGKSSLLDEISPLPADPSDFHKHGYKIVHIDHQGKHYVLSSHFQPSTNHSFVIDGVEENPGGTKTVQERLAREHFNYSTDINALLKGSLKFTSMDSAKRKDWFIRMCDTNYEYAIKAYNKMREKHRDVVGTIKMTTKRLVTESEKLIEDKEQVRLREEVSKLHELLNFLLERRKPLDKEPEAIEHEHELLSRELKQLARTLDNTLNATGALTLDIDGYDQYIDELNESITRTQAYLEKFSQEAKRNQSKIDVLQRAAAQNIASLKNKCQDLQAKLDEQSKQLLITGMNQNHRPDLALESLYPIREHLIEIFSSIPSNSDKRYSSQALNDAKEQLQSLMKKRNLCSEAQEHRRQKLAHMQKHKDHPDLACPKCEHRFSANYSAHEHERLQKEFDHFEKYLHEELNVQLKAQETFIEKCTQYAQWFRQYHQITKGTPYLQPYWDYLADKEILTLSPLSGSHELNAIEQDLKLQVIRVEYLNELKATHELLQALENVGEADLNQLIETNKQITQDMENETSKLIELGKKRTQAMNERASLKKIHVLREEIESTLKQSRQLGLEYKEQLRRQYFNSAVRELQSALASREHRLNALKLQQGVVDNITKQLAEYKQDEEALSLLVRELSPTEGVIAEGLMGFMKRFIAYVNSLIGAVWTYPMVIKSSEFTENSSIDLDYKFPMLVKGDRPRKDIRDGSTGMKEIVDFAFMLGAMKFLRLENYPIFLDEFGSAMDSIHKTNSVQLIKRLMDHNAFSQIFMISHDYMQYTALANAQVCVLCADNIVTPEKYNQHVTFH